MVRLIVAAVVLVLTGCWDGEPSSDALRLKVLELHVQKLACDKLALQRQPLPPECGGVPALLDEADRAYTRAMARGR